MKNPVPATLRQVPHVALLVAACAVSIPASATNRYFDCATGNLLTASCWSANTRPGVSDAALIGDTGYGFDVTATLSAATPAFTPQYEWIAYAGHNGTVNQSAGTNGSPSATYLISIGYGAGLTGTYNLSGTGVLNAGNTLEIGAYGTGTLTQTGGTSIVPTTLYLGTASTGNGTYNLQGGTLDANSSIVSTQEYIGYQGTGTFIQTGGTHTGNGIYIGAYVGSHGSYDLSGTGILTGSVTIGGPGTGTFSQSGGTATLGNLYLNGYSGGSGTATLSGTGSLTASYEFSGSAGGTNTFNQTGGTHVAAYDYLGYNGAVEYNQTGGTHTVNSQFLMGGAAAGAGTYNLRGGSLTVNAASGITDGAGASTLNIDGGSLSVGGGNGSITVDSLVLGSAAVYSGNHTLSGTGSITAGTEAIGDSGAGLFTQTGGTNTIGGILAIAANAGSSGTYNLQGGSLSAVSITNRGTLAFSAGTLGGAIDNQGSLNLSGAGTRVLGGSVVNNGTVDVALGTAAQFDGVVSGAGGFTGGGTSTFNGGLHPGNSPAQVNVAGNIVLGVANTLQIELAGLTAGSQYDRLNVSGDAWLDGLLEVMLPGPYNPSAGDSFDVLLAEVVHGSFGSTVLPGLSGGLAWDLQYLLNPTGTDVVRLSVVQAPVPVPAAAWLFGSGLLVLARRRAVARTTA